MPKQVNIELMHYRPLKDWKPQVGDLIIKHGWIVRTKWFGVVNFIHQDGTLDIIKDGMIRLLVITPPDLAAKKMEQVKLGDIAGAFQGTYAVHQCDQAHNLMVWYV